MMNPNQMCKILLFKIFSKASSIRSMIRESTNVKNDMRRQSFNKGLNFDFKSALKLTHKTIGQNLNSRNERPAETADPKDSYSIQVNDEESNTFANNVRLSLL